MELRQSLGMGERGRRGTETWMGEAEKDGALRRGLRCTTACAALHCAEGSFVVL